MTMFGSTVAVPFILAGPLCISNNNLVLSEIISTIFCVSGIATLLQSSIGNRFVIKLFDQTDRNISNSIEKKEIIDIAINKGNKIRNGKE